MPGAVTVGSLIVNLSANTAELKGDFAEATTSVKSSSQAIINAWAGVTTETGRATDAGRRLIAALKDEITTFGMTDRELQQHKANLSGVGAEAQSLIARIQAMKSAEDSFKTSLAGTNGALDAHGKEAKKAGEGVHSFSLENAGAKRELLVLAHELSQGNYKKFAGSLMVLGEQTGAAGALFSAAGLAAIALTAAVFGTAAAMVHGASQQKEMNDALILTGNYAGLTSDALNDLAHAAVASGGSVGEAKKAVTALAASGKFTGEQIASISTAVVAMQHATGESIDKTIEQFESLAVEASGHSARAFDGVSRAALKLDDQYHFLTLTVYDQIRALEREGDIRGASMVATEEFAKVTKDRADEIAGNLGSVARGWNAIKEAIGGAVDAVGELGRKSTPAIQVASLTAKLNERVGRSGAYVVQDNPTTGRGGLQLGMDRTNMLAQLAKAQAELNAETEKAGKDQEQAIARSEGVHAAQRIDAVLLQAQKKSQSEATIALEEYHASLDKLRKDDPTNARLAPAAVAAGEAAITKAHTPAVRVNHDDPTQVDLMASIKAQDSAIALEHKQMQDHVKYLAESYASENINAVQYYAGKRKLIADDYAATQEAYAKEAADVISRRAKLDPATQQKKIAEANKELVEIEAKRAAAAQESAKQMVAATSDQLKIQTDFNLATAEWVRQSAVANDAQAFSIGLMGKSAIETELLTNARRIYLETEERIRLVQKKDPGADVSGLRSAADDQVKTSGALIQAQYDKQRDGAFGASEAVRKYGEAASNTGSQIEGVFTHAFQSSEDALTKFLQTGKLSFTGFATSIIADLARIEAKNLISSLTGSATGSSILGSLGALFGGGTAAATGTNSLGFSVGSIDGFADGGDPPVGKVSMVGERGPELFVPKTAGTILPAGTFGAGGKGDNHITYSPTIHIDGTTDMARNQQMIGAAVKQGNANLVDLLQRQGVL